MKYRAFLSYSHADRKWARWLHRKLESYRPPKTLTAGSSGTLGGQLRPIFRDRDDLPSTSSLSEAVNAALRDSEWLIVICSPQAAGSHWVNEEIRAFRTLGKTDRILCFIVDGEPEATNERNCFPKALLSPDTPGGTPPEPVAADARPEGDGRHNAMLKIASGMLGVGFDALRQRDVRRRHQRLVTVAAGSLAITALTIVLAVSAILARNEAQERRAQAEDLIDFMLGDLRVQLRKIGRLDVFQSVGDKALEYFAAQRDGDDSEYLLSQRARNLRQIGDVRMEYGDLDAALEAFNESLLITSRLARQNPDDADAQIAMANSRFYVGYVHWQRGNLVEARALWESVIPIVDRVSAGDPDNPKWLVERAWANTNLGRALELEGELEAALLAYRSVMEVNERLLQLEPDNSEWQLELGFANNNLGKLFESMGRLDEAELHFRKDLEIKQQLYDADPGHNVRRSYLAVSQYFLGQLLLIRGDILEAEKLLLAADAHFAFLTDVDPERQQWAQRRANIERELGRLLALSGRVPDAEARFQSSIETLERAVAEEPQNAGWRRDLVRSLLIHADFRIRRGNTTDSLEEVHDAEAHIRTLVEQEPGIPDTYFLLAFSRSCQARLEDQSRARTLLNEAIATLDEYFGDSSDPNVLELRKEALAELELVASTTE